MTHPGYPDTQGVWDSTVALPEQLRTATTGATAVLAGTALPGPHEIRSVAVFGMGTSAIAADAVAAYAAMRSSVPIWVGHGYESPSFVGPDTLVFALSASGSTEETVSAAAAAHAQGALVVMVSGSGALTAMAIDSGAPLFEVPATLSPRTALGALTVPVLATLARIGLTPEVTTELDEVWASLSRRRDTLLGPGSPTAEVARRIGRTIPLVYGSTGVTAVAARRWKTQVNENAKTPAFCAVVPELSHDELAGWGQNGDVTRQVLTLITLRHAGEHPQVARQFELVVDATDEVMANVIPVWAEDDSDLSTFFNLVLFGDLVSLHMAGRERTDPGPVPALTDLGSALRS